MKYLHSSLSLYPFLCVYIYNIIGVPTVNMFAKPGSHGKNTLDPISGKRQSLNNQLAQKA